MTINNIKKNTNPCFVKEELCLKLSDLEDNEPNATFCSEYELSMVSDEYLYNYAVLSAALLNPVDIKLRCYQVAEETVRRIENSVSILANSETKSISRMPYDSYITSVINGSAKYISNRLETMEIGDINDYLTYIRDTVAKALEYNAFTHGRFDDCCEDEQYDFEEKEYDVIHVSELGDDYIIDEDADFEYDEDEEFEEVEDLDDDEFEDEEFEEVENLDDDEFEDEEFEEVEDFDEDEFEDEEFEEGDFPYTHKSEPDFKFSDFPDLDKLDLSYIAPFIGIQPPDIEVEGFDESDETDEFDDFEGFDEYDEDDIFGASKYPVGYPKLTKIISRGMKSVIEEENLLYHEDLIDELETEIKRLLRHCFYC